MPSTIQKRLRIAIVTTGRFHVCDLARELIRFGHEVKFYSLVPPWRTKQFGLPTESNRWMLPRVAISATATRLARSSKSQNRATQKLLLAFDNATSSVIQPCDVLIGMSGMCNKLAVTVKEKFGAQVWIERGSRHILSQKEILDSIPGADKVSAFAVDRELQDYEQANTISVLAKHCEESFLERGIPAEKLVRNPLGVNLKVFHSTVAPPPNPPTIIMTGTWSLQKGCDILVAAWRQLKGTKLIHVGPIADCPLPNDAEFVHFDKVDQSQLVNFYARAHVFALASRQEGLATVQPQALACGLRLVCTTRTGGEDLIPVVADQTSIQAVLPNNVPQLTVALKRALELSRGEIGERIRLRPESRDELSWSGYGQRYHTSLCLRT